MKRIEKRLMICSLAGFTTLISVTYYSFLSIMLKLPATSGFVSWAEKHHIVLSLISELTMFSAILLLIFSHLLQQYVKGNVIKSLSNSFTIILAIALVLTSLFSGRLVYQVYGLALNDQMAELVISAMVATLHMVSLALAVLILLISFSLAQKSKLILVVGIVAALAQFVMAYPWLVPFESASVIIIALLTWSTIFMRLIQLTYFDAIE